MPKPHRAVVVGTFVLTSVLGVGASASRALADEAPSASASALGAPPLAFSVTPGTGGGPWRMKVENTGDVPVRIAADPRLLVLEVAPPAGFVDEVAVAKAKAARKKVEPPKTLRCELPADARPSNDEGHDLVVPAKRSWSATFDPFFYCFGARERAMLVSGATVTAHYGWPAPPPKATTRGRTKPVAPAPPFVAAPVGAALGKVAPAKDLEAAPFTLSEDAARPPANAAAATTPVAPGTASLVVSMPASQDVARGAEISTTVTVANEGDKAAILLFRPETLRFNVAGPAGSVSCGATRTIDSPIRELYSTVGVKGRSTISLLITAMCPADTFDEPGVYRVTPVLDTTGASARSIGLKSWDGTATGNAPLLLRVRSARRPPTTTTRPALD